MAAVAPEPPSSATIERGWPAEHWHGAASRVECSRPVTACVLGCAYACCAPCPCRPCREVTAKPIGPFSHAVRFARMCAPWLSLRPILEWNCEDIPVLPRAFVVSNDGDLEPYAEYAAHVDDPGYSGRYRAHDGGGLGASVPGWIGRGGGDYAVLLPHGLQQSLRARRGLAPRVELCVVERPADGGGGRRLYFRFRTRADRRDWLEGRGLTATTRAIAGAESMPKSAEKSDGVDHSAMLLLASAPGPMFAEIAELVSSTGAAGGGALSPAEPLPDARALFDDLMARPRGKFVSVPDVDRRLPRYNTMLVHIATVATHEFFRTDAGRGAETAGDPPRLHRNLASSALDLQTLYGISDDDSARVRAFEGGRLRVDAFATRRLGRLPGVRALLTLFSREHNRIADELRARYPEEYNADEKVYQQANDATQCPSSHNFRNRFT